MKDVFLLKIALNYQMSRTETNVFLTMFGEVNDGKPKNQAEIERIVYKQYNIEKSTYSKSRGKIYKYFSKDCPGLDGDGPGKFEVLQQWLNDERQKRQQQQASNYQPRNDEDALEYQQIDVPLTRVQQLRKLCIEISPILANLTETLCFTAFSFHQHKPDGPGQFWKYELTLIDEDGPPIEIPIGYFVSLGQMSNAELAINQFFDNNDLVMNKFAKLADRGVLEPLVPLLRQAETFVNSECVVCLNIYSWINGGNKWLRDVCNEYILIMHLNEESKNMIDIGCQQSERRTIQLINLSTNEINFLTIPYDKVAYFNFC